MNANTGMILLGVLLGIFIVFLICRELMCWYFKINRMVALMEEQNELLRRLAGTCNESRVQEARGWVCKKCGKENKQSALFCNSCGEKKA